MTDKELKHLNRAELIEIIYELQQQKEEKDALCIELQNRLEKKELILTNAGSISDASIQINGVLEAAQAAADQYLLSVKSANSKAEQTILDAKNEHDRIIQEAQEKAKKIEEDAWQKVSSLWIDFQKKVSETIQSKKEFSMNSEKEE